MSEPEKFLTRWSRRKLEPAEKKAAEEAPAAADAPAGAGTPESAPAGEAPPKFDISTLPSLDSIGASSDIRPFLQAGVPSALRHAALRRAWSADPAIRDFVGLNENFWDGIGLDNVPGFGALDPSLDVKKLVSQIFGGAEPTARADNLAPEGNVPTPAASDSPPTETKTQLAQNNDLLLRRNENGASHHDDPPQQTPIAKARRHGGAMPE